LSREILKESFPDFDFTEQELSNLAEGKMTRKGKLTRKKMYLHLFNNVFWYDIIDAVSFEAISEFITDDFIANFKQKDLREGLTFVRHILREKTLPSSG